MPRPQWSLATPPTGPCLARNRRCPDTGRWHSVNTPSTLGARGCLRRRLAPHFRKLGLGQRTPGHTPRGHTHRRTPGHANTGTHRNWIAVCPGDFAETGLRCVSRCFRALPHAEPVRDDTDAPGLRVDRRQASGTGIDAVVAWINGVGNSAARATHASHLHSSMRAGHADIAGRGRSAYEQQDSTSSSASAEAV